MRGKTGLSMFVMKAEETLNAANSHWYLWTVVYVQTIVGALDYSNAIGLVDLCSEMTFELNPWLSVIHDL
jgi:hypothetical protein